MKVKTLFFLILPLVCQAVLATEGWSLGSTGGATAAGGKGVCVAVIDTGISTTSIDSKRLAQGKNYIDPNTGTEDTIGHGTAVAGILVGAEKQGLLGVAPEAVLVPLVCATIDGNGNTVIGDCTMWAQAICDAVDEFGCSVINLSMGTTTDDEALRSAVAYAEKHGAVVVSSVGNDNDEAHDSVYYPAAYPTVLGVAALDKNGEVADFSQRNASVALCAPGVDLKVAGIRGNTISNFGTSFSTAYVSGAAALLLSLQPDLKPAVVRQILCASAKDLEAAGYDKDSGWGALQIETALSYCKQGIRFRDIPTDSGYCSAVRYMSDRGLLSGISVAIFDPDGAMTRGMLWTVLARLDGQDATGGENGYAIAQAWATAKGISDGSHPTGNITREQLAVTLRRFAQYREADTIVVTDHLTGILDSGRVSDYAVSAMRWAVGAGLLQGDNKRLNPMEKATRAQVAIVIYRLLQKC